MNWHDILDLSTWGAAFFIWYSARKDQRILDKTIAEQEEFLSKLEAQAKEGGAS